MYSTHECSAAPNSPLGVLLCLLVIAYIFYLNTQQNQVRTPAEAAAPVNSTPVSDLNHGMRTPYDEGYYDGMKSYVHFDLADIRRTKQALEKRDHDLKEWELRLDKKLHELARGHLQMDEAMRGWREEYLKVLWEVKQKGERGLLNGLFKFGSPKASRLRESNLVKDVESNKGAQTVREEYKMVDGDIKKG